MRCRSKTLPILVAVAQEFKAQTVKCKQRGNSRVNARNILRSMRQNNNNNKYYYNRGRIKWTNVEKLALVRNYLSFAEWENMLAL